MDPHHFGNLDPYPDPHLHQINQDPDPHHFADYKLKRMEYLSLFQHFFIGRSFYLQARIRILV
jgi:hypothetical protein